jgi:Flp pilus assembly protein TadG
MPIMLCMLTGIFSFSQALYQKLQLEEAISVGGRTLAASRGVSDPCATAVSAVYAAAPGFGNGSITFAITIDGKPYTNSCTAAGGANNALMPAGSSGQIVATAPCSLSIYNVKGLNCALGSQITEVIQ